MTEQTKTAEQRWVKLVEAPFDGGYPTPASAAALRDEIRFQRGVQLYDWAMPAVSLEAMRLACQDSFGGGCTTLTSWRRIGPETLAVTSNPDVSYAFAWLDLKADGPTVIDAAPNLQGLIDDAWQRPITDIGLAGPDAGAGGKFLIVPPGFDGPVPDGYFLCQSRTFRVFVFLRGFFSPEHPDAGLAQINATSIYPLAAAGSPPPMNRVDGVGVPLNGLPPADNRYFTLLADILGNEPADREDFTMRGFAATLLGSSPDARLPLTTRSSRSSMRPRWSVRNTPPPLLSTRTGTFGSGPTGGGPAT